MPHVIPLDAGFSTADAGYPELLATNGVLRLIFKNWQERSINVIFQDVPAFRWQEAESLLPSERDDCAYELVDSEWVKQHISQGILAPDTQVRHLRFNFNSCGQLEVLCGSYEHTVD